MDDNYNTTPPTPPRQRPTGGRIGAGLFLLLVGGVLLMGEMGLPLPSWLFSWHALLIAIGIFTGFRHGFRGGAWLILIAIGGFFLIQDNFPGIPLKRFFWPAVLIFVGIAIIFAPRRSRWRDRWEGGWGRDRNDDWKRGCGRDWRRNYGQTFSSSRESYTSGDFIDSTAIFGGVHKKIVSKNLKGGDVTTVMGGTELDLSQADFTGVIHLEVTQVMGGTKIIVPPHWEVRSEINAIFAGFEDKRVQPTVNNPEKVLILEGTSIFAGVELKNY